jgi:hypothetical protein
MFQVDRCAITREIDYNADVPNGSVGTIVHIGCRNGGFRTAAHRLSNRPVQKRELALWRHLMEPGILSTGTLMATEVMITFLVLPDITVAQTVSGRRLTSEAHVSRPGASVLDLWRTKSHWNRIFPSTSVLPCRGRS